MLRKCFRRLYDLHERAKFYYYKRNDDKCYAGNVN